MAVTLQSADNALKSYYLDVVSDQLNNKINPFFSMIEKNSEQVWGKEVRQLVCHGINGGIGAGTEDGMLPKARESEYVQFVSDLKNLYGVVEISDKAVRASENNAGAFVNLLNYEMDNLIKSSAFNFGRMLFGDGSGTLAKVYGVNNGEIQLDTINNVVEGMIVDFYTPDGTKLEEYSGKKVISINRDETSIKIQGVSLTEECMEEDTKVVVSGSYNKEITGLKAIFNVNSGSLYGLDYQNNSWMKPYIRHGVGNINEVAIQMAIDNIEAKSGSVPNLIICSWGVRRTLQKVFANANTKLGMMELQGGYNTISYNGIPIVADRFCPNGTIYLLNTDDFTLHQLCDWQWLTGDDGKVLKQVAGKPVYTATLVKYAELMCARPFAQGMLTGVTES